MKLRTFLFSAAIAATLVVNANAQSITAMTLQTNTQQQLTTADPIELTAGTYNFTGMGAISAINFISVTLTLQDGNTGAPDAFDAGRLFLALDMINTGLALNGFPGNGLEATLTISGFVSPSVSAALMAAFADFQFVGTIIRPGDAPLAPANDIFVGNDSNNAITSLTVAVPEPSTYALIGAGVALLGLPRVRRLLRRS